MPTISQMWDIKSLIEHYASIEIKGRPATVHGVLEYHSNCPWCGGTDRFITRPETGQYSCAIRSSGCGRTGDCLDFLKDFMNMSHSEACEVLGLENNADFIPSERPQNAQSDYEYPPCKEWQQAGIVLVEKAQSALWSPMGKEMLTYLHSRGLRDEIIKKKRLGYVPLQKNGRFYEADLESWGLDPSTCAKDKVRIPNGILIPWFEGLTLWRLALKRPDQPAGRDYGQVVGSGEGLYNVDMIQYDFPAMMVEGEICAMSVEQEAGDLLACVATGSTTRARLARWVAELHLASYVLQSFDEDASGDEGAHYWEQALKKCQRWSPYNAKDPNDILCGKFFEGAYQCSLREWVERGIEMAQVEFELIKSALDPLPYPPCTVEKTLYELVNEHLKEKRRPPLHPPMSEKELGKAFSRTKIIGPGEDWKAQAIREYTLKEFGV